MSDWTGAQRERLEAAADEALAEDWYVVVEELGAIVVSDTFFEQHPAESAENADEIAKAGRLERADGRVAYIWSMPGTFGQGAKRLR